MARLPFHDDAPFFTALEAAAHLLHIARERDDALNHRQVQSLLYYAHGFCLSHLEKPLISDPIEVGDEGVIIESIEREYERFGDAPIRVAGDLELNDCSILAAASIYATHLAYKGLSEAELARTVLAERPCQEARANGRVISRASMVRYWKGRRQEQPTAQPPPKPVALSDLLRRRSDVAAHFESGHGPLESRPLR